MRLVTKIKIFLAIAGIIVLAVTQKPIQDVVIDFLSKSIPFFSYIKEQVSSGSLAGVVLHTAYANIPILPSIPSEAYAIFAYLKGTNIFLMIPIITGVYMVYASIYYFIGYLFGLKLVERMTKKKIKFGKTFERFAGIALFFLYLLPLPIIGSLTPVLVLYVGAYKAEFKKVIVIIALATLLRFLGIILLYNYYTPLIERYFPPIKSLLKIS